MNTPFASIDAALIRLAAPTDASQSWPDLTGEGPQQVAHWREWLSRVWADPSLAEVVEIASPHLAARIEDVCAGRLARSRRVRRVVESAVRYLLRRRARATPFGLFAGVAPLHLGPRTIISSKGAGAAVARPDAVWLASLITHLEIQQPLLACLSVVADNRAFARDGRWVLPWRSDPEGGQRPDIGEVSVRRTRAVWLAVEAARSPITVRALTGRLEAELPGTSRAAITNLLTALVAQQMLITSLRPPMESTDPLNHLLAQFREADPQGHHSEQVTELESLRDLLVAYGSEPRPRRRRALRAQALDRMRALHPGVEPRIAVDLRVDGSVALPRAVRREAEHAAAVLSALAPHPSGSPAWQVWHSRFLERYGENAIVPLVEATDPAIGLGWPPGYLGASGTVPVPALSNRDRALLRLAQQAALDSAREVVLDREQLRKLTQACGEEPTRLAPHTELRFSLQAPTPTAVDQGMFTLSLIGASRQAGTLIGRFLDLMEQPERARMKNALAAAPSQFPGAVRAQVSCPPLAERTHDVARAPAVLPRIVLGQHPGPAASDPDIDVRDLAVTGDSQGLRLMSLSLDRPVEPTLFNAVALRRAAHPLARFLCEVTTARSGTCRTFDWGAAEDLPFLPRLRYQRTVLVPARWNLTAADLPAPNTSWAQWHRAWQDLHHRLVLPESVLLGEDDRHLRLDTAEPAHLVLLRRHLEATGHARITEAPPTAEHGWIGERAHEIVLPMAAPHTAPPQEPRPRTVSPIRHLGHHPGVASWLYARLHAHPDRHDAILTGHVRALLEHWAEGPLQGVWFVRSRDPAPHLRLRMRLHGPQHYGAAAQRLGAWADSLRSQGLLSAITLETYYPEVARFGAGPAMAAAEKLFAADSSVVRAQLTTAPNLWHRQALTAASIVDLAQAFTGGPNEGRRWLVDHPPTRPASPPPREVTEQALALADPHRGPDLLTAAPGGEALIRAWRQRCVAAAAYRACLDGQGLDTDRVLSSLLHLHHNRMAGPDREAERGCLRLARASALAQTARSERRAPSPQ